MLQYILLPLIIGIILYTLVKIVKPNKKDNYLKFSKHKLNFKSDGETKQVHVNSNTNFKITK